MAEINFSSQDTGACPYCKNHNECGIQDSMTETLGDVIHSNYDDEMEIVIYTCPNFAAEDIDSTDDDTGDE